MDNFKIRDRRGDNRYFVDNIFLKRYGAKLGPHCIAVYSALAMYANADTQKAWPSFQTIADLVGMSRQQVIREIKKLKAHNIIEAEKRKEPHPETGKPVFQTDVFTLLHPDEWNKIDECLHEPSITQILPLVTGSHQPSICESPPLVTPSHLNNTNKNNTQLTKPKESASKATRPPTIPAMAVFFEITKYFKITKYWQMEAGRIVGDNAADLEFWRKVVIGWTGKYQTVHNIKGMLEYFERREVPGYKNGATSNGKYNQSNKSLQRTGESLDEQPVFNIYTGEIEYPDGRRVPGSMP